MTSSSSSGEDDEIEVSSESLYGRRNVFRKLGFFGLLNRKRDNEGEKRKGGIVGNRWSDCGCESCISWQKNGDQRLYVVIKNPSEGICW